ncbi:unnamed protein product [Ectocarpus sp. 4 AP-2014]
MWQYLQQVFCHGPVYSVQGWKASPHQAVADVLLCVRSPQQQAVGRCLPSLISRPPCPCWMCLRWLLLAGRCCVVRTNMARHFGFQ